MEGKENKNRIFHPSFLLENMIHFKRAASGALVIKFLIDLILVCAEEAVLESFGYPVTVDVTNLPRMA